jgi:hypothetical protein
MGFSALLRVASGFAVCGRSWVEVLFAGRYCIVVVLTVIFLFILFLAVKVCILILAIL